MKAIVFEEYGDADVLRYEEVATPSIGDDEVLVRVRAASINPYDWHFMTGLPYLGRVQQGGLRRPANHRLGADLAGVVASVGSHVTAFRAGDEVFGEVGGEMPGQPRLELGSCAEYVRVGEYGLVGKPANVSFEEAAAAPLAAVTALQGLRDYGRVKPGDKVLINGASGGVGTYAVQIAKAFAAEVTGVCSAKNVELVRSLGADHVYDYTTEDFTTSGRRYDVVLDNVGNRSLADCRRVLAPTGTYIASFGRPENRWVGPLLQIAKTLIAARFTKQELVLLSQDRKPTDLQVLADLMAEGKVTSVIDRSFPLPEVPAAMRHLSDGHVAGKVVITV
jgi:NADPH:quinone reductase-like Zn-dependent oxidoreductase